MANTSRENACRYLDSQMVPPMRYAAIARGLYNKVVTLPAGKTSVDFDTISEMGDALMEYHIPTGDMGFDNINVIPTVLRVPNIFKGWKLERAELNAYLSEGKQIAAESAISAMYVMLKKEENFLLQGWYNPAGTKLLDGLYSGAGNDYATAKAFSTDGLPTDAVLGGLALNDADGVPPMNYNLILNPTQFRLLQANVSTTSNYNEMENIMKILNPMPGLQGRIINDAKGNIVAGTGLLVPVDVTGAFFDLVVCEQPQNIFANEKWPGKGPIEAMVFEAIVPRIKQAVSLCKLSNISG